MIMVPSFPRRPRLSFLLLLSLSTSTLSSIGRAAAPAPPEVLPTNTSSLLVDNLRTLSLDASTLYERLITTRAVRDALEREVPFPASPSLHAALPDSLRERSVDLAFTAHLEQGGGKRAKAALEETVASSAPGGAAGRSPSDSSQSAETAGKIFQLPKNNGVLLFGVAHLLFVIPPAVRRTVGSVAGGSVPVLPNGPGKPRGRPPAPGSASDRGGWSSSFGSSSTHQPEKLSAQQTYGKVAVRTDNPKNLILLDVDNQLVSQHGFAFEIEKLLLHRDGRLLVLTGEQLHI